MKKLGGIICVLAILVMPSLAAKPCNRIVGEIQCKKRNDCLWSGGLCNLAVGPTPEPTPDPTPWPTPYPTEPPTNPPSFAPTLEPTPYPTPYPTPSNELMNVLLTGLIDDVAMLRTELDAAKADIQSNTADIQVNNADIQSNTADIQANTAGVLGNLVDISGNTASVTDLKSKFSDAGSTEYSTTSTVTMKSTLSSLCYLTEATAVTYTVTDPTNLFNKLSAELTTFAASSSTFSVSDMTADSFVIYGGNVYATMDLCPASYSSGCSYTCQNYYIEMPTGWQLATYSSSVNSALAAPSGSNYGFGTSVMIYSNGNGYYTSNGSYWSQGALQSSGNSYRVTSSCGLKLLMQRPLPVLSNFESCKVSQSGGYWTLTGIGASCTARCVDMN